MFPLTADGLDAALRVGSVLAVMALLALIRGAFLAMKDERTRPELLRGLPDDCGRASCPRCRGGRG